MPGVLDGIRVLDLTSGFGGPVATMLLADHGAHVTRIETADDPYAECSGYRVWHRGKRSAALDLADPDDRARVHALAGSCDVVVETFAPGVAARLGLDHATLAADHPGLISCSITGYGSTGPLSDRPAIDALVSARTGHIWEGRGQVGTSTARLAGLPDPLAGVEIDMTLGVGAPRPGPLFPGVPWVSLGAAYLAVLGVSAALRVRAVTGRGQWVQTSLLQGALATTVYPWQRAEKAAETGFLVWVLDPRSPKGILRCADGRWIHQWTPLPSFFIESTRGAGLEQTEHVKGRRDADTRVGIDIEDTVVLAHYQPEMAAAAARFTSAEWAAFGAKVGVTLQPVRSPEEALADPEFLADGCVVELVDPELGPVRQVGRVYSLSEHPAPIVRARHVAGADTDEVRAEADALRARPSTAGPVTTAPVTTHTSGTSAPRSPLDGVLVVELGLAIAVPYGAQLLAGLGAEVVKVQRIDENYWMSSVFSLSCNRGKRSLAMDLKSEEGRDALMRLLAKADVLMTNMRASALVRLGLDAETVLAHNPRLVYCHTRGFDRGSRDGLTGLDQSAAALVGTEWLDGACDSGGIPYWSCTSLGDLGVGLLAAIGTTQALYARETTDRGQVVDTSLVYAHLLNASMSWTTPAGGRGNRQSLDRMQLGWSALYRLYQTADDWLCVAAMTEDQWHGLCRAVGRPDLTTDVRFSTSDARAANAEVLGSLLEDIFAARPARAWWNDLEAEGVPSEVTSPESVVALFDDPDLRAREWIKTYEHSPRGTVETAGHLVELSDTPGVLNLPTPLAGEHSAEILREFGYDDQEIADLVARGVVFDVAMSVAEDGSAQGSSRPAPDASDR